MCVWVSGVVILFWYDGKCYPVGGHVEGWRAVYLEIGVDDVDGL